VAAQNSLASVSQGSVQRCDAASSGQRAGFSRRESGGRAECGTCGSGMWPGQHDSRSRSPGGGLSPVAKRSSVHRKAAVGKTHGLSVNCVAPVMFKCEVRFVCCLRDAAVHSVS